MNRGIKQQSVSQRSKKQRGLSQRYLSQRYLSLLLCLLLAGCQRAAGYQTYQLRPNEDLMSVSGDAEDPEGDDLTESDNGVVRQLTVEDIQEMNRGQARMVFSKEGYLTFLDGTFYKKKVKDHEDGIKSIRGVQELLGLSAGSEFFAEYGSRDRNGYTYYTYKQRYGGYTVQYATLRVVVDPEGYTAGLACSFEPNIGIAPEVTWITPEEALAEVQSIYRLDDSNFYPEYTRRAAIRYNETMQHVYVVYSKYFFTPGTQPGVPFLEHFVTCDGTYLFSNATSTVTGLTMEDEAMQYFENKTTSTYTGTVRMYDGSTKEITVPIAYDRETNRYYLMDVERRIAVADYASFFYYGYVNIASSSDGKSWDNNHLIAYDNYRKVYDYYAERGIYSTDGTGIPILICCDWVDTNGRPVNNAGSAGIKRGFAVFSASDANSYSEAVDIVAHEFTHGVTGYSMGGCIYLNYTGAINEAYSDIMGNIIEMSLGETTDEYEWLIGEMAGTPMRNMSNPHKSKDVKQPTKLYGLYYYDTIPEEYFNDQDYIMWHDNGGVHVNNSLLSQMAYKLWEAGMSFDDQTWLWLLSCQLITPKSEFEEVYASLMMSLKLNGLSEEYAEVLTDSFLEAGLISAE